MQNLWNKLNPSGFLFRYYLVTFLSGLTFYISVLVPFYTQWGHLNLTEVQILQSWLMIWMFILNIPAGAVADQLGRKVSVSLGSLSLALSCFFYVLFPGFYPFLVAEFLAALGTAFVIGASSALIYDYLKRENREEESKKILGRSSAMGSLGTIIASVVGSVIAANFGISVPMLITAIPLLLVAVIVLTLSEPKPERDDSRLNVFKTGKQGIEILLKNRILKYLVVNDILVWFGAYFLVWLYQPMLIKLGLAIIYFGVIRSAFSLAGMSTTFNISLMEKIFGSEKRFINITALIVSASLMLVAFIPSIVTVVLAIVLIGGLATARTSYLNTTMNKFIPTQQRATVLSVTSTANMLVFAIANPIVGFAADHSLRLAFLIVGLLPLAAFLFLPYKINDNR